MAFENKRENRPQLFQPIIDCINNSPAHSFNTRQFPRVDKMAYIYTDSAETPVLKDICGNFQFPKGWNVEFEEYKIKISDPDQIVEAIKKACDANLIFLAQGGMNADAFSDMKVLKALNETPPKQFRVIAVGHSTVVPAAYIFADLKAQTPSDGGRVLGDFINQRLAIFGKGCQKSRLDLQKPDKPKNPESQKQLPDADLPRDAHAFSEPHLRLRKFSWISALICLILGLAIGTVAMSHLDVYGYVSPYVNKMMGWGMYSW